ncbi:MAG: hypothetical protein E6G94_08640 [Alphaproteobacteria bacterium]|nr:MAG: hypothetical protein E6G94_08640 [Alphaproteobacteria bacterium]
MNSSQSASPIQHEIAAGFESSTPRPGVPFVASDLIARAASEGPGEDALVAPCGGLPYSELLSRARRVAGWLKNRGVGRDSLVGICLERSFDQITVALGTWIAGGAYLPLDPSWPHGRLRMIAEEAGCAVIVGRDEGVERLAGVETPLAVLDWNSAEFSEDPGEEAFAPVRPDDLAYVIYTSGTTGRPKGVEVTHANLAHLIAWHNRDFAVTADDRASHLAGLGFDASVWEVWPYLCAGAAVVLATDEVRTSEIKLRAWLIAHGISVAFVPTALAQELIQAEWPDSTRLRFLLTGADRPDGVHGRRDLCRGAAGGDRPRPSPDRPPDRRDRDPDSEHRGSAGRPGRARRNPDRRAFRRPRLSRPAGPDRRALRPS